MSKWKKGPRAWVKWGLIACITVLICFLCYRIEAGGRQFDHEFDDGSRVSIGSPDQEMSQRLHKLCRVWGFAKYYHPKILKGDVNWDYELFRVLPAIIGESDEEEVNAVLYDWIHKLGTVKENESEEKGEIAQEAGTDWIYDSSYLSPELSSLLINISKSGYIDKNRSYVSFDNIMVPHFTGEESYPDMNYADQGYRMLGLFRYWNMIEYYYPYKDIIGEDWDSVFLEFLPRFMEGTDELSYKMACAELTTKIHDSHAYAFDEAAALMGGVLIAPFTFTHTGENIVVDGIDADYPPGIETVLPGDIILKTDGIEIWDYIAEKSKIKSRSRDTVVLNDLPEDIFRGYADEITLTVKRDDEIFDIAVPCIERVRSESINEPEPVSHRLLGNSIGYIDPGALKAKEIFTIMEEFKDTLGIIVDLLHYPSDFIVYSLGCLIMPEQKNYVIMSRPSLTVPGRFILDKPMYVGVDNPDYYKGKVVLLMNECTQSQAEFTIMALRQAPNAVVIGSPSIGADGNVANMVFPGAVHTSMTSLGVYDTDMSQTQRVGLTPDIYVEPTIQGIREGRDELIEKAVEVILESASS